MHRDNLRSAVYRSLNKSLLVGCEKSNETVGCETIGESKSSLSGAVEPMAYTRSARQGADPASFAGKGEERDMAFGENSELQLLQVSRGAHKLTHMIDSWAKAPNIDGRSKYIAKDLLRGALDLQESLIMLGKLQETSKLMQMRKKEKPDFMEERKEEEEIGFEVLGSKRFSISGYHNRLQEPRRSVDGSSRNCVEELKKVIRDSLNRQNLLSITSDDEKASSSRSLGFSASSRFEDMCYERKEKTERSVSTTAQPKKVKAPNLIAKLMGLEEVPSKAVQSIKKEEERKKSSNPPRPTFDIEMPKGRKLQLVGQNPDPKRKTLQEIIDTMQFKGLLKSNRGEDNQIQSFFSDTSQLEGNSRNFYMGDEIPPIVIMKPMHLPSWERGEIQKGPISEKISVQEEIQSVSIIQEEVVSHGGWVLPRKKEEKVVKSVEKTTVEEVQKGLISDKISVQEEIQSVSIIQEEVVSHGGRALPRKKEEKVVKSVEKTTVDLSQKVQISASVSHKQQRKEAIKTREKPAERQLKLPNRRTSEEPKYTKAITASKSQAKTTSTTPAKPDKRLAPVKKNSISSQTGTPKNHNQTRPAKSVPKKSTGSEKEKKMEKTKPVKKPTTIKAVIDDTKCNEDSEDISPVFETSGASTTSCTLPAHDLPKQTEDSKAPKEDRISKDQAFFCEVMPKTIQGGRSSGLAEEVIRVPHNETTVKEVTGIQHDLELLLLSSHSFLTCAQELCGLDGLQPVYYQRKGIDEVGTRNAKLVLDCAKELMICKSHRLELMNHPMLWTHVWGPTANISFDQLLKEIIFGIEKLISYSKAGDDVSSEDSLYIRLERDLRCRGLLVTAIWDIGWVNWFCVEEADQVVDEVQEHIFSGLIEEVVMDLLF